MTLALAQLDTITNDYIAPRIADNVYGAVPLLHRLKARNQVILSGGIDIREPLLYAKSGKATGFDGNGPLGTTMPSVITGAEFDWVTYESPVAIARRDEKMNGGAEGVIKLLENLRKVAEMDLMDRVGADLFTGNASASSTKELDGLQLMVDDDDTPKAYGGILTTDMATWTADDTALSAALSLFAMQQAYGRATRGSDHPSLVVCTQAEFDKYWSLLQADQRFNDDKMASAGFQALRFNGIPVVVDPN